MARFRVSVWVIATAFLAAACGGVQAPDSRDSAAATQKVAGRGLAAGRQAAGAPPTIVNPAEELKEFAPDGVLRWTEVPGADAYEVWAYTDYGASQLVETSAALTSRQYQFTRLVGGQTYYVAVYYRVNGFWGATPRFALQTTTNVVKPRLSNAQDELDAFVVGGILRWTSIAGAGTYEVWLFADKALTTLAETSGPIRERQYQVSTLTPGRTYYAQVYANINGAFQAGGGLPVKVVASADRARILNSQDELEAFATNGVLRWSAVTGVSAYEIWIYTNPNGSEIQESSGRLAGRSYATRTLQAGRSYYAQVYALVDGQWQVGAPVKLTTPQQQTVARLTNPQEELEAFATSGTLRWNEVPGADRYEVWIYGNAGLGVIAESGVGTERSYQVKQLCADAGYYVQVYARVNGQWTSGWATRIAVAAGSSPANCVPPVPAVTLAASPPDIVSGEIVTLAWSSRFANSCEASGAWSGARATDGRETVGSLGAPTQYSLACSGPSGTTTTQVLVTIANYRPVASIAASRTSGFTPVEVEFDATASYDTDGSIVKYAWDFGDGTSATGAKVKHTFTDFGAFDVKLSVTDDDGAVGAKVQAFDAMPGTSATRYSIEEIPSLGGGYVEPFAINNKGQVVGFSYVDATKVPRAFLYKNGVTNDLGTLGGKSSEARDISDTGFIVGVADTAAQARRAFIYRNGEIKAIGTLGGAFSEANGVNEAGHVVGVAADAAGFERAFVDTYGLMFPLGTLGGTSSAATDINDRVQITGYSRKGDGSTHAFLSSITVMTDIGTLGGPDSFGAAINDSGQIAGLSSAEGLYNYAFLYGAGVMQSLDALNRGGSEAFDLNDAGIVVGNSERRAFVWDKVNGMRNLNDLVDPALGLKLEAGRSINEWGQIAAQGLRADGSTIAVVLTPEKVPAN